MEHLPESIQGWLQKIEQDQGTGQREFPIVDRPRNNDLLRRAAQCYVMAQWNGDACRVFEHVGDFKSAAFYHEQEEHWDLAAQCHVRSNEWNNAARCFLLARAPGKAAECFLEAGQPLQAAWLWAHRSRLFLKALDMVETIKADSKITILSKQLIISRCEAGQHGAPAAIRRLKNVLFALQELDSEMQARDLIDWAFALADILRRPDLCAEIHAATFRLQWPDARENWRNWALNILGDPSGIPTNNNT